MPGVFCQFLIETQQQPHECQERAELYLRLRIGECQAVFADAKLLEVVDVLLGDVHVATVAPHARTRYPGSLTSEGTRLPCVMCRCRYRIPSPRLDFLAVA